MNYSNLSLTEILQLYNEIIEKLTAQFPEGSIEFKNNNNSAFIPTQVYQTRLEEAAGPFWSWSIKSIDLVSVDNIEKIRVIGTLKILIAERDGIGFAEIQRYRDTNKLVDVKYPTLAASSEALRDACNNFRMGWKDLAPYREWAKNPGVKLNEHSSTSKGRTRALECVVCNQVLTEEDIQYLAQYPHVKIPFCKIHLPGHMKKKNK